MLHDELSMAFDLKPDSVTRATKFEINLQLTLSAPDFVCH